MATASPIRSVRWALTEPEADLLRLINDYRRKQGRGVLALSVALAQAARRHSEAMSRLGFFAHVDTAGLGPADRITAAGYGSFSIAGE